MGEGNKWWNLFQYSIGAFIYNREQYKGTLHCDLAIIQDCHNTAEQ